MGGLRTLLAYAVLAVTVARAAASIDLSALPQCSVPCFISGLGISQCSPLDQDCLCHDLAYQANVTDCVKQSCKVPDQLITKNATWVGCGFPQNNHDLAIKLLLGIIYPTACAAVIARVVTKLLRLSTWGWDDYTILLAQVTATIFQVLGPIEIHFGLGRDIWTLTPYQIATFLKVFFIAEVSYTFELCIVKTSYLFFFLRVFQASPIRKPIIGTIIFTITAGAVFVLVDLVQCVPVELFWQQWDGEPHPGRCVNINAMAWSHAIINILLDFWMMALPASQVVRLRLAMSKKIGLVIMFSAGFLLTLVSILRLKSLTQFGESRENITMDFMMIAIYSPIECQAGIFCACLPAMSQLTQWMWAARRGQKDKNKTAASSTAKSKESSIHVVKTFGSQTVRRRGSDDEQELYILGYRDNHTSSVTAASGAADADADAEGSKTHLSESSLRHGGRGSTESPPG